MSKFDTNFRQQKEAEPKSPRPFRRLAVCNDMQMKGSFVFNTRILTLTSIGSLIHHKDFLLSRVSLLFEITSLNYITK